MHPIAKSLTVLALLIGVLYATPARAETFNTCAGFIEALPATISTQGVWCLNKNLSTAITSGDAITIATNNVTIDCNDFKIGGLAAGNSSQTIGIHASNRQNASVRHCNIRGFRYGIDLEGGAGHLVEDNRLDNNLYTGIYVTGDNNRVRRNAVYDTGGYPAFDYSFGIQATADVIDNTVAGVFATATDTYPRGILITGGGNEARGNRVRGLVVAGAGTARGLYANGPGIKLAGNHIAASAATAGWGIFGFGGDTFCTDNTVSNFAVAQTSCEHNVDNLPAPAP